MGVKRTSQKRSPKSAIDRVEVSTVHRQLYGSLAGTTVCGRAIRFVVYFFGLRHEPLENFGEFFGHRHLRVGRDEPLARRVRVFRIALPELLVFLLSYGTSHGVLALAVARPSPSR